MRGNPGDPDMPKRAYANPQSEGVLDINAFAKHITDHGSVYSRADVAAILTQAVDCIKELVLLGYAVELGELGKFSASIKSKGAKDFESFNPASNIRKVTVKWSVGAGLKNLKDVATFKRVLTREEDAAAKKEKYGN